MEKSSFWMASLIWNGDEFFHEAENPGYCRSRIPILAHLLLNFILKV